MLELDDKDVVVVHLAEGFFAFNNACPHLHLPLDARGRASEQAPQLGDGRPAPTRSRISADLSVTCRWHESRFDLQTGEIREWCAALSADGSAKGMEHLGDISKNRCRLTVYPCRLEDGDVWIALG
jgi:nitrite reductase/ring-hydroxylating ferredoxin subunit